MDTINKLKVFIQDRQVGTLARYDRYRCAFEYSREWLENGYSISPFSLPLEPGVKIAKTDPFEGLHGVFADSLPDGWGRLLVDRMLRRSGIDPEEADPLTRLSIVGNTGRGALEYWPAYEAGKEKIIQNLDRLAEQCKKILGSAESEDLDALFTMGGSSGGARPKVNLKLDDGEWIVKFPSSFDPANIGEMEYEYNLCAAECGIGIPEVRLFPSANCPGYFGSRRFDRISSGAETKKIHMLTSSALFKVSHRVPALDYNSLMGLTWQLTKDRNELEKMFKLMCFNVFAHNRDDHSNNFSFLYENGSWRLSPAYDLTYSNSLGGEHATTVAGEGKDPAMKDILEVAKRAGIRLSAAEETAERIRSEVEKHLSKYLKKDQRR